MEVILLEKVGKLGSLGDKVKVKAGFGRNYLIPFGKAVSASAANMADFEARRVELEKAASDTLTRANGRASELAEKEVVITAKAGEEGKLFGSVGAREISEAISALGTEVTKSEVKLPEGALRQLGEYDIDVQLHADVMVAVKVIVQSD